MSSNFFTPGGEDIFLGDSFNSSNPYSGVPNVAPSTPTQIDDSGSQFDRPTIFWESLEFDDIGSSGLQPNDLQSDDFQHIPHTSHESMFPKSYASGHNIQAPLQGGHGMFYPFRCNIGNTIAPPDSERSVMYKNTIYDNQDYTLETQHLSAFGNGFRDGLGISTHSVPLGNQFTSSDLGILSQPPNADDVASLADTQASCNSRCTSSVCENENCSVTGTPCDDPTCVENVSTTEIPLLMDQMPTELLPGQIPFHEPHSQPCNHTESEHLVARTLGELRAPAELDLHEKTLYPTSFNYSALSHPCEQLYSSSYDSYAASPSQPPEVEGCGLGDQKMHLQSASFLSEIPSAAHDPKKHICQWVTNISAPEDERTICGAEFTSTKEFHDHLCEDHVDKLTNQTGFACLWGGCSRKQDRPFVTRGKLRRHMSTHSVCKYWSRTP